MMAPTVDGFSAGTALDGTELYVGKGTNLNCGQMPCPAKIDVNPPAPGAYMSCADGENYDPMTAEYLQFNPMVEFNFFNYLQVKFLIILVDLGYDNNR